LFWDHTSRDKLHTGSKFGEALITKEACELNIELPQDAVKWWEKSLNYLREQRQMYEPIDAP